jgi:hypothetical protein
MYIRALGVALVTVGALGACHSAKDATDGNFAKAIDAKFSEGCVPVKFNIGFSKFPVSVAVVQPGILTSVDDARRLNESSFGPLDALVAAGLLTGTEAQIDRPYGLKGKEPGKVYALTDAGTNALKDPAAATFCAGHYKVDEVVNFTEPSNAMGATVSDVHYTFSPVDVPAWANSDAVKKAFPSLVEELGSHQKGRATLVLMNNGWSAEDLR